MKKRNNNKKYIVDDKVFTSEKRALAYAYSKYHMTYDGALSDLVKTVK